MSAPQRTTPPEPRPSGARDLRADLGGELIYVAVEGPIGVGKTTLVRGLQERLGGQVLLEVVEENPFLSAFYGDPARYAFQTQLFFLMSRFRQQKELYQRLEHNVLADYHLLKDRIFAELTLGAEELKLYEEVYGSLSTCVRPPDVLIYLHADFDTLIQRIQKRARPYEHNFDRAYLTRLCERYEHHFAHYAETPLLDLDNTHKDYVQHSALLDEICAEAVRLARGGRAQRAAEGAAPAAPC